MMLMYNGIWLLIAMALGSNDQLNQEPIKMKSLLQSNTDATIILELKDGTKFTVARKDITTQWGLISEMVESDDPTNEKSEIVIPIMIDADADILQTIVDYVKIDNQKKHQTVHIDGKEGVDYASWDNGTFFEKHKSQFETELNWFQKNFVIGDNNDQFPWKRNAVDNKKLAISMAVSNFLNMPQLRECFYFVVSSLLAANKDIIDIKTLNDHTNLDLLHGIQSYLPDTYFGLYDESPLMQQHIRAITMEDIEAAFANVTPKIRLPHRQFWCTDGKFGDCEGYDIWPYFAFDDHRYSPIQVSQRDQTFSFYEENCNHCRGNIDLENLPLRHLSLRGRWYHRYHAYNESTLKITGLPQSLKTLKVYNGDFVVFQVDELPQSLEKVKFVWVQQEKTFFSLYNKLPSTLKHLHLNTTTVRVELDTLPSELKELRWHVEATPLFNFDQLPQGLRQLDIDLGSINMRNPPTSLEKLQLSNTKDIIWWKEYPETLQLKVLGLKNNGLKEIDGTKLPQSLELLTIFDNPLTSFDVEHLPSTLKYLCLGQVGYHFADTTFVNKKWPKSLELLVIQDFPARQYDQLVESLPRSAIYCHQYSWIYSYDGNGFFIINPQMQQFEPIYEKHYNYSGFGGIERAYCLTHRPGFSCQNVFEEHQEAPFLIGSARV